MSSSRTASATVVFSMWFVLTERPVVGAQKRWKEDRVILDQFGYNGNRIPDYMSTGYEIEFRDDHVHVQLSPNYEFEPEGSATIWAEIKRLCDEHQTCRVLVEGHLPKGERTTPEII